MEKKCKDCGNIFIAEEMDYLLNITKDEKIDLQLICPKCGEMIEFTFIEKDDFMSLGA